MKAKKSKRARAKQRPVRKSSAVTPIAVRARGKSSRGVIPVAIKTNSGSEKPQALIPVEVETTRGKSVKRAALMPVAVKVPSRTKGTRKRHGQDARSRRAQAARREREIATERRSQGVLTGSIVALAHVEENTVNLAGQLGMAVLNVIPQVVNTALDVVVPTAIRWDSTLEFEEPRETGFANDLLAA